MCAVQGSQFITPEKLRIIRDPTPRNESHGYFLRFRCLPPVWNLRAVGLIPLFYICSFVLLLMSSPVALSVLSFSALGPFSGLLFTFSER